MMFQNKWTHTISEVYLFLDNREYYIFSLLFKDNYFFEERGNRAILFHLLINYLNYNKNFHFEKISLF